MPTFSPPTFDDTAWGQPDHPSYPLMRYYGSVKSGLTVWKGQDGNYHQSSYPYAGGATEAVFDNGVRTSFTGPDEGLATASEVYIGGHIYPISTATYINLAIAGYFPYLNIEDVVFEWERNDAGNLFKETVTVDGTNAYSFAVQGDVGVAHVTGAAVNNSNARAWFLDDRTLNWADSTGQTLLEPSTFIGGTIYPQQGLVCRGGSDGVWITGIAIWYDIAFGSPTLLNIGCFKTPADGSTLTFRSFVWTTPLGPAGTVNFPYNLAYDLTGISIKVKVWKPNQEQPSFDDPVWAKTIDLTSFGDPVAIPVPTQGSNGFWCGHGGTNTQSDCRFGYSKFHRKS